MTFYTFSQTIAQIEKLSSRLDMTRALAALFREMTPDDYVSGVYLIQGQLAPKYASVQIGLAEKMVLRAIARATQSDLSQTSERFGELGDIGMLAEELKSSQRSFDEREVNIREVHDIFLTIARAEGPGSQDEKLKILASLLRQIDPLSARYIARIPIGALRLGFSDMTILDSLSWMMRGDKTLRPALQRAYQVFPDLGEIGRRLKIEGESGLDRIAPQLFTPVIMMRAERLSSGEEIINQIGTCIIEPKFDGFRLQIHKSGDVVKLFTRGLEDATHMYPDIVAGVQKEVHAHTVILEGEALGYDPVNNLFLPFQETVQRKRKYDIAQKAKDIPLKLFAFELLYLDGKSFIEEPLVVRKKVLETIISARAKVAENVVLLPYDARVSDPAEVERMFDEAIGNRLEGIIAKKLDGQYEPGARGWNWIKLKRSYSSKIQDTIDCVVLGYDYGKGKRTEFGIGAFLVGVWDPQREVYCTLAKIGTGLTDEEWRELKAQSEIHQIPQKPPEYLIDAMMHCDVWVRPEIVVEIKADEITRSPVHTAGRVMKPSKSGNAEAVDVSGYALRFPRLVGFRTDKLPQDATSVEEIQKMHAAQFLHNT